MNVLSFFAHPDDETMLCGGTLALLARRGAQVHYLSATRGEGGEAGEPPLCSFEELGQVRSAELHCAVQALGGASLLFWDYIDPRVGPDNTLYPFAEDADALAGALAKVLRELHIDVLFTHGSNGEYGHPAHKLTHQAALTAVARLDGQAPLVYTTYAAFEDHPKPRLMNRDDPAHLVVDISAVLPQKIEAALCHRTQHALFVRNASRDAGRPMQVPEVIVNLESFHRAWPPALGRPDDALASLLLESKAAYRPDEV